MKFRLIPVTMTTLALGLSTLVGSPAASAAKNDWASYYPSKGTVCTMKYTQEDGTVDSTVRTKVLAKTKKQVVERSLGMKVTTKFTSNGGTYSAYTDRSDGDTVKSKETMPSLAKFKKGKRGTVTVDMALLVPKSERSMLTSGKSMIMKMKVRMKYAGTKSLTLGDATVNAIGISYGPIKLSFPNLKTRYRKVMKEQMATAMANLTSESDTEWLAKKRGTVMSHSLSDDMRPLVGLQQHCK